MTHLFFIFAGLFVLVMAALGFAEMRALHKEEAETAKARAAIRESEETLAINEASQPAPAHVEFREGPE